MLQLTSPPRDMRQGARLPAQEPEEAEEGVRALPDGQGFAKDGVEYRIGDCLYVHPDCFDAVPSPAALICCAACLPRKMCRDPCIADQ